MKAFWRCSVAAMGLTMGVFCVLGRGQGAQNGTTQSEAQKGDEVQPQATAEDVLASLVHHSAVIFAGEVYAIRMPQGMKGPSGVSGLVFSSRPDAVEVEFRVDMGIRGASIGSNYVLRIPVSTWQ